MLVLVLFVSLVFVSVPFSLNDDDDDFGGSKSSSSLGIFVRANRVGPRQTPSSRAALKRMSSSSPQKREKQREIQQKEEKQRAKMKLLAKDM